MTLFVANRSPVQRLRPGAGVTCLGHERRNCGAQQQNRENP